MYYWTFVILQTYLFLFLTISLGQLPAPTGLAISNLSYSGFIVRFDPVPNVFEYEVNVTSFHDSLDTFQIMTSYNVVKIKDRRSNILYVIRVRGKDRNGFHGTPSEIYERTTPNGSDIVQAITASTFLTVFMNEAPGVLNWELEIVNSITMLTRLIRIPHEVPSRSRYVAVITNLDPNTLYHVRARVLKIPKKSLTVEQSPFGPYRKLSTERLSVFGRVELLTHTYSKDWRNNTAFIKLIEYELREDYQRVADNVFWVTVIQLFDAGNKNVLCHHEILLDNRETPPPVVNLTLNDNQKYKDGKVRFGVSSEPGYSYNAFDRLRFKNSGRCIGSAANTEVEVLKWKAFSLGSRQVINIRSKPTRLGSSVNVKFIGNTVQVDNTIVTTLKSSTIYGIKHDYLVSNCPSDDRKTIFYDRIHQTKSRSSNLYARDYTVMYATGVDKIHTSRVFARINRKENKATLIIPATLIPRVTSYEIHRKGEVVKILSEEFIDSSNKYKIELLNVKVGNVLEVQALSRGPYGMKVVVKFNVRLREGALYDDIDAGKKLLIRNHESKQGRGSKQTAPNETIAWLAAPIAAYFGLIIFTASIGCYLGRKFHANQRQLNRRKKKKQPTKPDIAETKKKTLERKASKTSKKTVEEENVQEIDDVIGNMTSIQNDVTDTEVQAIFANNKPRK